MNDRLLNLLPQDALGHWTGVRRIVIASRLLWGFGVLLLIVSVFSVAAWQYVGILETSEKHRRGVAEQSEELRRATTFEQQLRELTEELRVLRELRKPQYDPRLLVRDIVSILPQGVTLNTLTLRFSAASAGKDADAAAKTAADGREIFIAGFALTRSDVLAFQHALESLPDVESVDAPVENILKPTNTNFSFSVILKPLVEKESSQDSSPKTGQNE